MCVSKYIVAYPSSTQRFDPKPCAIRETHSPTAVPTAIGPLDPTNKPLSARQRRGDLAGTVCGKVAVEGGKRRHGCRGAFNV